MLLRFGGTMDTEKMFELADRLRALRDEKAEAEQHLKEIKAEMDSKARLWATFITVAFSNTACRR